APVPRVRPSDAPQAVRQGRLPRHDVALVGRPLRDVRQEGADDMTALTRSEIVEDAEYMACNGETWPGALRRLDMTADALDKALRRAGRTAVTTALKHNDNFPIKADRPIRGRWAATPDGAATLDECRRECEPAPETSPDKPSVTGRRRLTLLSSSFEIDPTS